MAASRDLGEFIRELRSNARISLRQLAQQAGVSNPYLSQIERGLRKPSAEVLQQIANALRVSTPLMYLRAGLLAEREGQGVPAAIAADPDLSDRHKKTLIEIYEAFRRENVRVQEEEATAVGETAGDATGPVSDAPVEPAPDHVETGPREIVIEHRPAPSQVPPAEPKKTARKTAKKAVRKRAAATAEKNRDDKEKP